MKFIEKVKRFFKKGGYALTGKTLNTINDHPKVNIDPIELDRIQRSFREYRDDYDEIHYLNSNGDVKARKYMSINMRKLTAQTLASLVFNEQVAITIDDDKKEQLDENRKLDIKNNPNDFIQHVFEHNDFKKNMSRYLEPTFVAGGLVVRPYVDQETGEIEFSWGLADSFFPIRSNSNGITDGAMQFVTIRTENDKTVFYTLLEFHEWQNGQYQITNELYRSERRDAIGKLVPLDTLEIYEGLESNPKLSYMSRPLFNYLKPFGFNNIVPGSPLGLGICDNSRSTLKQINDTFDQFNWEIRMGQRTVLVTDHLLNYDFDEQGNRPKAYFDPDVNIFKKINADMDTDVIKDITSDIRTTQYVEALNQSLKALEMELQFSPGTFSFDGKSVKTATEIVSENSLTYRTRNVHVTEVEKFIKGLIVSVLELAKGTIMADSQSLYSGEIPSFEQISVDFDDGVFEDRTATLDFYNKAVGANLIPRVEAMQRTFKCTEKEAVKWLKMIENEAAGLDPTEIEEKAFEVELGEEE